MVTALLASAVTMIVLRWELVPGFSRREQAEVILAAPPAGQPTPSSDEQTNIKVYEQVSPGVVNITRVVVEFDFFLSPIAREGTGSGIVLDQDGNILTNYHVIAEAENLEVALPDQTKYQAEIVGTDSQNDIAVIHILNCPKERLHPIAIGDSSSLKVGQKVLAIGNPFRLQNTMTVGIISSLGRRIQTADGNLVENVIQTDAAINPGNSGGPLLNAAGELIGINTQIVEATGANVGIGFALPANTVRRVVTDLIRDGRVIRPWFGVDGYSITEDLASALDLPVTQGVMVVRVYRGSSADSAGIRGASAMVRRLPVGGDIITQVDDRTIISIDELKLAMETKRPGDTVNLTIFRGKAKVQKPVTLVEAPRQRELRF